MIVQMLTKISIQKYEDLTYKTIKRLKLIYYKHFDKYPKYMSKSIGFKTYLIYLLKHRHGLGDYYTIIKHYSHYMKVTSKIPTAGSIIIWKENIILVKTYGSQYYSFPKGKKESNEFIYKTAKRETFEETGLKINIGFNDKFEKINNTYYYSVNIDGRFPPPYHIIGKEITDIVLIPIKKINTLLLHRDVVKAIKLNLL